MPVTAVPADSLFGPRFTNPPPLSLYLHLPWCVRKCPYCDFNSHPARGEIPEAEYVEALIRDLEQSVPLVWGRRVETVFFGGGTPSLFSADAIDRLLTAVRTLLPPEFDAEITLEANPGTVEADRFRGYRAAGVNRLSLGVQSFNDRHLRALGRVHDAAQAARAVEIAARHFDNFNLDLMYALPGQTADQALADVDRALDFSPTHLSAYHLTLEPNTPFHRAPPPLPDDDTAAAMQDAITARLAAAGFEHYETSAFARPRRACRHNLNYWRFGDYLGIGAGAHGKLSFHDRVVRQARVRQPRDYMQKIAAGEPAFEEHVVPRRDLPFEFAMNALRLCQGVPVRLFEDRTGLPLAAVEAKLRAAEARGLLARDHDRLYPTERGRHFLNDLLQIFLPAGRE